VAPAIVPDCMITAGRMRRRQGLAGGVSPGVVGRFCEGWCDERHDRRPIGYGQSYATVSYGYGGVAFRPIALVTAPAPPP